MTSDVTRDVPFASEFPPATREDWLKLVRAALKDRLSPSVAMVDAQAGIS